MPNCSEGAFGPSTAGSQRTAGSLKMDSSLLVLVIAFRSMRLLGVSIPLDPRRARKTLTLEGSPQEIHTKGVGNRKPADTGPTHPLSMPKARKSPRRQASWRTGTRARQNPSFAAGFASYSSQKPDRLPTAYRIRVNFTHLPCSNARHFPQARRTASATTNSLQNLPQNALSHARNKPARASGVQAGGVLQTGCVRAGGTQAGSMLGPANEGGARNQSACAPPRRRCYLCACSNLSMKATRASTPARGMAL